MHKDVRKILKAGTSSFAVVLPKSWLRYYDLKNGDSVEVISNGSIEIKPIEKGGNQAE